MNTLIRHVGIALVLFLDTVGYQAPVRNKDFSLRKT